MLREKIQKISIVFLNTKLCMCHFIEFLSLVVDVCIFMAINFIVVVKRVAWWNVGAIRRDKISINQGTSKGFS